MVFTRIPRSGCGTAEFRLTCPAARDARGDLSLAKERLEDAVRSVHDSYVVRMIRCAEPPSIVSIAPVV